MNTAVDPKRSRHGLWTAMLAGAATSLLLLVLTRNSLQHVPMYDELLHILAARGWLQQGQPVIADGLYERALLFTRLVAMAMARFGDTLVVARIPALLGGGALVFALACWMTRRAGWVAGIASGMLLCVLPVTIQLSVFARFYTLHALVILLIAMVAYEATDPCRRPTERGVLALVAAGMLPLAWHLQESTAIAAGAVFMATAAVLVFDHWAVVREALRRYPLFWGLLMAAAVTSGILALNVLGLVEQLNTVPLWASGAAHAPHYYFQLLAADLPLLWPLTGVAILCALRVQPRLVIFCTVLFVVGLAVHSIAAAKAGRYVYYLMPFLCAIWACALSAVTDYIRHLAAQQPVWRRSLVALLLIVLLLTASQEGQRTLKLLSGRTLSDQQMGYEGEADWSPLVPPLGASLATADRVITSNAMKALYYLGRYDYELNASIVRETDSGTEFGIDRRTGKQAIAAGASVSSVLEMPGTTIVVLEEKKMGLDTGVSADALSAVEKHCSAMGVEAMGVRVWRCMKAKGSQ